MNKYLNFVIIIIFSSFIFINFQICLAQEQTQGSYLIGAGDILEITTWKEPDFSREEVLGTTRWYDHLPTY